MAVVPIKISWLTIPLACEPKGRGLVRWTRWDATSSASRFGQGLRRRPQRVFPDRRPSCHPDPPVCKDVPQIRPISFSLTPLWDAHFSRLS